MPHGGLCLLLVMLSQYPLKCVAQRSLRDQLQQVVDLKSIHYLFEILKLPTGMKQISVLARSSGVELSEEQFPQVLLHIVAHALVFEERLKTYCSPKCS
jgi:hypothetical protein